MAKLQPLPSPRGVAEALVICDLASIWAVFGGDKTSASETRSNIERGEGGRAKRVIYRADHRGLKFRH